MAGRNVAGLADVDVGATNQVEIVRLHDHGVAGAALLVALDPARRAAGRRHHARRVSMSRSTCAASARSSGSAASAAAGRDLAWRPA